MSLAPIAADQGKNMPANDAQFDARLSSIEAEVRRIADSLTLLIRVDERVVTLFNGHAELKGRVEKLEQSFGPTHWTVSAFTKFGWIVAAGMLAFGFNVGKDALSRPAVVQPIQSQDTQGKPRQSGP